MMKPSTPDRIKQHKDDVERTRKSDPRFIKWLQKKLKKLKREDPNIYPMY